LWHGCGRGRLWHRHQKGPSPLLNSRTGAIRETQTATPRSGPCSVVSMPHAGIWWVIINDSPCTKLVLPNVARPHLSQTVGIDNVMYTASNLVSRCIEHLTESWATQPLKTTREASVAPLPALVLVGVFLKPKAYVGYQPAYGSSRRPHTCGIVVNTKCAQLHYPPG